MGLFPFKSILNSKKEMSMLITFKVSFIKEHDGIELKGALQF